MKKKLNINCPYFVNSECQFGYLKQIKIKNIQEGINYQREYCTSGIKKWKKCEFLIKIENL